MNIRMPDYSKGRIYRLFHSDGRFYIGSTCSPLYTRKSQHKWNQHFFKADEWKEVQIVLIELYSCANKEELFKKENEILLPFLKDDKCLNKNKALWTAVNSF
jgi:hypothetical protein